MTAHDVPNDQASLLTVLDRLCSSSNALLSLLEEDILVVEAAVAEGKGVLLLADDNRLRAALDSILGLAAESSVLKLPKFEDVLGVAQEAEDLTVVVVDLVALTWISVWDDRSASFADPEGFSAVADLKVLPLTCQQPSYWVVS